MATTKIAMQYDLRQNNAENRPTYELWYPRAVSHGVLNLKGLSNHIADHGSIYTPDVVYGVLRKFTSCLVELVSQGVGVKLDGLGTFYPTLESKGAETPVGYDLFAYLQGVHIRFRPENAEGEELTSRVFARKVAMKQRMLIDKTGKPKKILDGQIVDYETKGDDDDEHDNP